MLILLNKLGTTIEGLHGGEPPYNLTTDLTGNSGNLTILSYATDLIEELNKLDTSNQDGIDDFIELNMKLKDGLKNKPFECTSVVYNDFGGIEEMAFDEQ